jgi:hypothetical protein
VDPWDFDLRDDRTSMATVEKFSSMILTCLSVRHDAVQGSHSRRHLSKRLEESRSFPRRTENLAVSACYLVTGHKVSDVMFQRRQGCDQSSVGKARECASRQSQRRQRSEAAQVVREAQLGPIAQHATSRKQCNFLRGSYVDQTLLILDHSCLLERS